MEAAKKNSSQIEDYDPVDSYFNCITACSLDDSGVECVTRCVEVHLKGDE